MRHAPESLDTRITEQTFADPFGLVPIYVPDLLEALNMSPTLAAGHLYSAALDVAGATKPIVAKESLTHLLCAASTGQQDMVSAYAESVIPGALIEVSSRTIKERGDVFRNSSWLKDHANKDVDLAIELGIEKVGDYVTGLYARASTEEQRGRIVSRFEHWLGILAK